MKSTKIISNLDESLPIRYTIKAIWGLISERSFTLTIFSLPNYSPKIPSNEVIDIGGGHLLGFMSELAIGTGTGRLALPVVSSENKTILLHFTNEFLKEMDKNDLLSLQKTISSTLDMINSKQTSDGYYLDKLEVP